MYRCACLTLAAATVAFAASAQVQVRNFPPGTLRGSIVFGGFPEVTLNGDTTQLSPGTRIRDEHNRIVLPGTLYGNKMLVHYTVGMNAGQVQDVWILTPDEAAIRPWPRTLDESRTWSYDSTARAWTKP